MKVMVTKAEYVELEQRLTKIAAHARSLIYVALHERAKGDEVWSENSRTEAGLEFLEVMLDEMLIATLGSDALLTDTVGDPYEAMPDVMRDPEIAELLEIRQRASYVRLPTPPDTPATVLGAVARVADAILIEFGGLDSTLHTWARLLGDVASGRITVARAREVLDGE